MGGDSTSIYIDKYLLVSFSIYTSSVAGSARLYLSQSQLYDLNIRQHTPTR